MEFEKLRYPIGKFSYQPVQTVKLIEQKIEDISSFPTRLVFTLNDVSQDDCQKKYRPGGWSLVQLVHHLADSHMNSFIRFKLALTEENPTIKPYFDNLWAELPDATKFTIKPSLQILQGLHHRWGILLNSMQNEQWKRTIFHPEHQQEQSLFFLLQYYAWHGNHHLEHIKMAIENPVY